MENQTVVPEPQNTPEGAGTPVTPETVSLTKEELDDLTHRAEVSSQNFERLKKAEEEAEKLRLQLEANAVPLDPDTERVGKLETTVEDLKSKLLKSEVLESYPILKDKWSDLEEFRSIPDNKGLNLRTAAKAFLVEKGLLEPQRPGLERQTGGPRAPVASGMSAEDVMQLRTTNYKKYSDMIRKGQIKFS